LTELRILHTDNYRLCCEDNMPEDFNVNSCFTQHDPISSCRHLLRSDVHRWYLWVTSFVALTGNAVGFFVRLCMETSTSEWTISTSEWTIRIFHLNLYVADFLTGVYGTVIGAADHLYRGRYLRNEETWKRSLVCNMAGVLLLLSFEVSTLFICLMTLDRVLVLQVAVDKVQFRRRSAVVVCAVVWLLGTSVALIPAFTRTPQFERFYSQTGLCLPSPEHVATSQDIGFLDVVLTVNIVLGLLVFVGLLIIHWSLQNRNPAVDSTDTRQKMDTARSFCMVIASNAIVWILLGAFGLVVGDAVSVDVKVMLAILSVPINSAINPTLHALCKMSEKRNRAKEARMLHLLESRINAKFTLFKVAAFQKRNEDARDETLTVDDKGHAKVSEVWLLINWLSQKPYFGETIGAECVTETRLAEIRDSRLPRGSTTGRQSPSVATGCGNANIIRSQLDTDGGPCPRNVLAPPKDHYRNNLHRKEVPRSREFNEFTVMDFLCWIKLCECDATNPPSAPAPTPPLLPSPVG
ncbi:hypothetical protein BaRGS_00002220, partial [Batillaria attramentaria]